MKAFAAAAGLRFMIATPQDASRHMCDAGDARDDGLRETRRRLRPELPPSMRSPRNDPAGSGKERPPFAVKRKSLTGLAPPGLAAGTLNGGTAEPSVRTIARSAPIRFPALGRSKANRGARLPPPPTFMRPRRRPFDLELPWGDQIQERSRLFQSARRRSSPKRRVQIQVCRLL